MAALLALLLLHPGAKPPPPLYPVIGKALTLCVKAGMTEEDVVRVFGPPDSQIGFGSGPPGDGYNVDCLDYTRYGVSVSFVRQFNIWRPSHKNSIRVEGTLE